MKAQPGRLGPQVCATLVVAACFVQTPLAAAAAPADACALLTRAEVAAALGVAVDPGERLMPTETRSCSWSEHGKNAFQARNVHLVLLTEQSYERGKTPLQGITKTPESGIGDNAYFIKGMGMVFALQVKKGTTYFQIRARSNVDALAKSNTPEMDERDKEIERGLSREILKKL